MGSIDVLSDRHGRLGTSDFPYQLSEKDYMGDISQSLEAPKEALPDSFPSQVQSSLTWTAADLGGSEGEWIMRLTPSEARAIDEAVAAFIGWYTKPCEQNELTDARIENANATNWTRDLSLAPKPDRQIGSDLGNLSQ
jgi:hypothetical protein